MIEMLIESNEMVLFGRLDEINQEQIAPVLIFLETQYNVECLGYPAIAPSFHQAAASWSSKLLFCAAQLMMYREHSAESLTDMIKPFSSSKSTSAILTADLCLRYLPSIIVELEYIDVEDELIPLLKQVLKEWHYSGLLSKIDLGEPIFDDSYKDPCLLQLYTNRVIETRQKKIGQMDKLRPMIMSAFGNYEQLFWKEFNSNI